MPPETENVKKLSGNFLPGLILFLLAPFVGEVLPGARSFLSMFNPLNFIILTTLYGCGAVIVRETVVRWKKGWPSVVLLGLAYGIVEEGIGTQSFANPSWGGLSVPALYGRAFGVNWVWIPQIMFYHSLISISLSILIVGMLFPERRDTHYVSSKTVKLSIVAIVLNLAFEVFGLFPYNAGPIYYVAAISAVTILSILAWKAPRKLFENRSVALPKWTISVLSFVFCLLFFMMLDSYIPLVAPSLVDFAATLALILMIVIYLGVVKPKPDTHFLFYVSAGAIAYFAITAVIYDPIDVVSSVFFILLLLVARYRLKSAEGSISIASI